MREKRRESRRWGGGWRREGHPVRSAVNVRANMFWSFFFLVFEVICVYHM